MFLLRSFRRAALVFLLSIASSLAQPYNNPIIRPRAGETIDAGTNYTITWNANTGTAVSLELWNSFPIFSYFNGSCIDDEDNPSCSLIFYDVTNSGEWVWQVPSDAPTSNEYFFDIYVPDPGIEGPYYYMTGNFTILNKGTSTGSTTSSASAGVTSTGKALFVPSDHGKNRFRAKYCGFQ